ncbi:MAG: AEC family transporter [Chitinophagaceae bacterium]|nr:AEC family transporter [Oligoflexus sp.]
MPLISLFALLGLIVGLIVQRKDFARPAFNQTASKLLVQMIYPCLIFSSLLSRFEWNEITSLARMPILIFTILIMGLAFGRLTLNRSRLVETPTRRAYVFLSIMPNYSYVPLVIAQLIWGDRGVALVAMSSVAADISLWTFAYPQIAGIRNWRKMFSPALVSILTALIILRAAPDLKLGLWPEMLLALGWIGKLTLPLSMYILGTQLALASRTGTDKKAHALLLLWRLLLCPFIMMVLLLYQGGALPYEAKAILLLVSSMPGAVITVVLAHIHDADGQFAATQILIGHGLALVTVGFWQLAYFMLYLHYF